METATTGNDIQEAASILPPATGSSTINLSQGERIVSTIGGVALTVIGLRKLNTLSGVGLLLGGGILLSRGVSGYCALTNLVRKSSSQFAAAMEVEKTIVISSPRSTVYAFWRKLENLPQFMKHFEEVTELDDHRSKWTASLPGHVGKVSWEATITEDISGELISWTSLPGSIIDNAGEVRFKDVNNGMATELAIRISYRLPGGDVGSLAAKLFNPLVEKMMNDDIEGFQQLMESHSNTSQSENQSTSRAGKGTRKKRSHQVKE